jgi:PadR family transcriptional regulator AphA
MGFEYMLLGLLAMRPYSGYDLRRWLELEGQFYRSRAHHSQIYRLLSRMVDDGWVEFTVDPRVGRPDAKVYRLTAEGRRVLLEWAHSPYEPTSRFLDPDFSIRLTFAGIVDRDAALAVVKTELDYRKAQVARSEVRDRTLRFEDEIPEIDTQRATALFEWGHQYGAAAVRSWIAWLEQVQQRLESEDYTT